MRGGDGYFNKTISLPGLNVQVWVSNRTSLGRGQYWHSTLGGNSPTG